MSLSGVTSNKEPGRVVYLGSLSSSNPSFARIIFWTMEGGFSGKNLAILTKAGVSSTSNRETFEDSIGCCELFFFIITEAPLPFVLYRLVS